MEIEKRIPRYYKIALFGIGAFFSLYEKRQLQEGEYHKEETREIPIYRLEQKNVKVISNETDNYESYRGYQTQVGFINACNSFEKDGFFYDEGENLLFYTSTFIYAERKKDAYFDLVTGLEIPRYAIEQVEKVTTLDDYKQLECNIRQILAFMTLYQEKFVDILKSYENRKEALIRLKTRDTFDERRMARSGQLIASDYFDLSINQLMEEKEYVVEKPEIISGEPCDNITFEELIAYKREIVDSGIQSQIDSDMKKIKIKTNACKLRGLNRYRDRNLKSILFD